jgi:DNA-binding CsgD family transcriptional regulator
MDDTAALLELIARTYDAARGVAAWGQVAQGLADLLGAHEIGLRRHDPDDLLEPAFVGRHLSEEEFARILKECPAAPGAACGEGPATGDTHRIVTGVRACSGKTSICALTSAAACYFVSACSRGERIGLDLVAICRTGRPPFEEGLAQLRVLLSHLQRANELERERLLAGEAFRGLVAAASQSPNAVLIVDGTFRIRFRNGTAARFLAAGAGWSQEAGRLVVDHPDAACALRRALGRPTREAEVLRVDRMGAAPGMPPLLLVAEPLTNAGSGDAPPSRRLLVVLAGPAVAVHSFDSAAAAALYHLSPAESRLAERLGEGTRLDAAAGALGITLETARTYLKSLFRKTGTARQSELVRLLLLGPRRMACAEEGRMLPTHTHRTVE